MREPSTEHARLALSAAGFRVEDIPVVPDAERADLRLWFGDEEYVLEAKVREPHPGWSELVSQASADGYATKSRRIDPWNALSRVVRKAHDQVVATPAGTAALRVLWVAALNDDADFVIACLEKRLLGSVQVVGIDPSALTVGDPKTCFHYSSNDFELCPGIDAAVLSTRTDAKLYVNYFSPRRASFRQTHLHRVFAEYRAVIDPETQADAREAFVIGADFTGPRGDNAQRRYLYQRYGVRITVMQDHHFAGLVTIPTTAVRKPPG